MSPIMQRLICHSAEARFISTTEAYLLCLSQGKGTILPAFLQASEKLVDLCL